MANVDNPFASPEPVGQLPKSEGDPLVSSGTFVSGSQRAFFAALMLVIGIGTDVAGIVSDRAELDLLERIKAKKQFTQREAEESDSRQQIIGIVQIAVYLVTVVAFLMWFHRAHRNLLPLGATKIKYSPGWAVGGFFVPFLNLVRPYQVMKEVRKGSNPRRLGGKAKSGPGIVSFWWGAWLIANLAGNISIQMISRGETIDSLISANTFNQVAEVTSILAAIFAILVVLRINADQQTRHKLLNQNVFSAEGAE